MKTTNKFIAASALMMMAATAAFLLTSCQQDPAGPENPDLGETEVVIPVTLERPINPDADAPGTKVTVNPASGATAWEEGDQVAVWIQPNSTPASGSYVTAKVKDSAIHLNIDASKERAGFAIYPAAQWEGDSSNARVKYPTTYNMSGKTLTSENYWAPTPMMALNAQGSDLNFFHVGGLLRLHVTDLPSGTTGLTVTFVSSDPLEHPIYVTGTFDVANPGTLSATTSYNSTGGSAISFTNLTGSPSEVYLNIPLPSIDFSYLSAIRVSNTNGTVYTAEKPLSGWGTLGHAQGKKLPMSFFSIDFLPGYDGSFNGGLYISPGILKYDGNSDPGSHGYTLTSGEDPYEVIKYSGQDESKGVYYHALSTVRSRINPVSSSAAIGTIAVDGTSWRVPLKSDWETLTSTSSYTTRYNSLTPNIRFFYCTVNFSGATEPICGYDYSGKGNQTCMIILPEYVSIVCPEFSTLSFSTCQRLIDAGSALLIHRQIVNGSNNWEWSQWGSYWTGTSTYTWSVQVQRFCTLDDGWKIPVKLIR